MENKNEKIEKIENEVKSNILKLMSKPKFALPQEDIHATMEAYDLLKVSEFSNSILSLIGFGCAAISCDIEYSQSLDTGII